MFSKSLFFFILFSFVANSYGMQSAKVQERPRSKSNDYSANLGGSGGLEILLGMRGSKVRSRSKSDDFDQSRAVYNDPQKLDTCNWRKL